MEESRGCVGDLRAAEIRVHGETAEGRRFGCDDSRARSASCPRARRRPRSRRRRTPRAPTARARSPSRISSRSFARTAARNGSTSSCVTSSTRKSDVVRRRPANRDRHAADSWNAHAEEALARGERRADRDEREPGEHRGRHRLVEQDGPVHDRERGHEVRHDRELATSVQAQHAEEQELAGEGRDEDQGGESGERGRPGHLASADRRSRAARARAPRRAWIPWRARGPGCLAPGAVRRRRRSRTRATRGRLRACPRSPTSRPAVSSPVSAATPRKPSATPAIRSGPTRSCGRKRAARRNVKIGTVDCAMPATLESMWVSPQATSPIGTAPLMTPSTRHGRHAARSSSTAARRAHAPHEVGGQQQPGAEHAQLGHRGRRDVLDGDLDEEVRRAPHRREQEDQRPVRAHRAEATHEPSRRLMRGRTPSIS